MKYVMIRPPNVVHENDRNRTVLVCHDNQRSLFEQCTHGNGNDQIVLYEDYCFPVCFPDPEVDYDWALMKLMNSFPDCARVFLEDILDQCNGDYEQAYTLLIST